MEDTKSVLSEEARRALTHGHGLKTIAGYRVVETSFAGDDDQFVPFGGEWFAANRYTAAIALATDIRRNPHRNWAVVDTKYTCGCWGTQRSFDA